MPFCPSCRAEFRAGFDACNSCGGVTLVEALPESLEIPLEELEGTVPVGLSSATDVAQIVEIDGRQVDLMRVFSIKRAHDFLQTLLDSGVRCAMVPLGDVDFPDGLPRVEVRVRPEDHERGESILRDAWKSDVAREGTTDEPGEGAIDACPACGSHVPLDVEECPECGLVVGVSSVEEDDEEEEGSAEA